LDEWNYPPFEPTIVGNDIYARGSADNKGQFMIHIMAVKKLLESHSHPRGVILSEINNKDHTPRVKNTKTLPVNFKFIIEGEEEVGSPSIEMLANKYSKTLFKCDYLMVSDTGMRIGQPTIDIGLRGLLYTEVALQTAKHDVHSGECGGIAENPINLLSRVISKLKNDNGKIINTRIL
jgi:acetylornithine deacetylase/succinyl-diaminopimelate desuccinylase-like protein